MKLRELLSQMKEVQQKIGSSEPYICGGTPRDKFLKRIDNISDIDITTGDKSIQYLASEFGEALSKKYNVSRQSHHDGHSTFTIGSFKMDFSSNFNVPNIESILVQQGFDKPTEIQKEMFSRDFTCNSLLLSFDLKTIKDPTKMGFKDLNDKVIKTCLAPEITLTTNKNRVIRAIYLSSKLDFDIDQSIVEYVLNNPDSIQISTQKALMEKTNEAFSRDPDRAVHNLNKMKLWDYIPITDAVKPYLSKKNSVKVAYFQGGGGVNEPAPKEKKYKSDPAIVVQPRFKEPFYHNYDLYKVPGMEEVGPGVGWHSMQNYKSVQEFIKERRDRLKPRYVSDDSWIQDDGSKTKSPNVKARASLLSKFVKIANPNVCEFCGKNKIDITFPCEHCGKGGALFTGDENNGPNFDYGHGAYDAMSKGKKMKSITDFKYDGPGAFFADDNAIDFPIDDYFDPAAIEGEEYGLAGESNLMGGYLDEYLPENDFEGKDPTTLDFGRDYIEDQEPAEIPDHIIDKLLKKYHAAPTHGLYGLPDGVDLPDEDLGDPTDLNPDYGTLGPDSLMYEDKWNI
jgi:tRNA nucleotidyltransferase/poly(A) polymerase